MQLAITLHTPLKLHYIILKRFVLQQEERLIGSYFGMFTIYQYTTSFLFTESHPWETCSQQIIPNTSSNYYETPYLDVQPSQNNTPPPDQQLYTTGNKVVIFSVITHEKKNSTDTGQRRFLECVVHAIKWLPILRKATHSTVDIIIRRP